MVRLTVDGHGFKEVIVKVDHFDVVQVHELVQRSVNLNMNLQCQSQLVR